MFNKYCTNREIISERDRSNNKLEKTLTLRHNHLVTHVQIEHKTDALVNSHSYRTNIIPTTLLHYTIR